MVNYADYKPPPRSEPGVEMERQSGSPEGSGRQAFKGSPAKIEIAAE
jgi:hypothetical protein